MASTIIGINSTSDVWKFYQKLIVRATLHDYLFIISMTKLDTSQCQHHILSPKPSPAILSTKSFSYFVKAKFGAFVRLFI
jgi:hypothetical protein